MIREAGRVGSTVLCGYKSMSFILYVVYVIGIIN